METEFQRLQWLRKRAEIPNKREAANVYGIGYEVYKKIESDTEGRRRLTREHAETIAGYHHVSPGWLMFGEGTPEGRMRVQLLGSIGAGQMIDLFPDSTERGVTIDGSLANVDAVAFEVSGDSMEPLAHHLDIVFFSPETTDFKALIGQECAVVLEDGRRFFKTLEASPREGLYNLVSYNAKTMRDQIVHSAGLFLGVKRNRQSLRRR